MYIQLIDLLMIRAVLVAERHRCGNLKIPVLRINNPDNQYRSCYDFPTKYFLLTIDILVLIYSCLTKS